MSWDRLRWEKLKWFFYGKNLLARFVTLAVAVGLWVYVMTDQNPIVERNFSVELQPRNLPAKLKVFNMPATVTVRIRASRTEFDKGVEGRLIASIDLQNIAEGQRTLPVYVDFPKGDVVSVKPNNVSVYVDTVDQKKVVVQTRTSGSSMDDVVLGTVKLTPMEVILQGATHRLQHINKVAAPIDTNLPEGPFVTESELVAVSDDGYDVPDFKVIPARALVEGTMVKQLLTVELPVELVMMGNLPEGVKVTRTEITPARLHVSAPPSVLRDLKVLKTKPYDVSRLTENIQPRIALDLPDKVLPEASTVNVRFTVESLYAVPHK